MHKRSWLIAAAVLVVASAPLFTSWMPLSLNFPAPSVVLPGNHAFLHDIGARSPGGWNAYYRVHRNGYLAAGLKAGGEDLAAGTYRYDFYFALRPGHFINMFSAANDAVRVEVADTTTREILLDRTFQMADFSGARRGLVRKGLTFSTLGRAGHRFEPRVYWQGLTGIFLARVERVDLGRADAATLRDKTADFERMMQESFLDKGFVILRDPNGRAADTADAAIWTGTYVAAEAWRYNTTRDPEALANLERSLWALHSLVRDAPVPGTVVRYVRADGRPHAQTGSKDTYTGFFYGVARGLPYVKSPRLRLALLGDLDRVAGHFLDHDLAFVSDSRHAVDMNPYLDARFVDEAAQNLREDPQLRHDLITTFRYMRWYFWVHGESAPPAFGRAITALEHPTTSRFEDEFLPLASDARRALKGFQRYVHQSALRGPRQGVTDTPYTKLDLLLLRALHNFDESTGGRAFTSLEDVKVRPSESLHALHFIKVAAELLPKPNRYDTYYHANLFENKALLRTAIQWHQIDEDAFAIILGETEADTRRTASGHLSYLALHDLILLEKDPILRFKYQKLFEEQFRPMRQDGNAMIEAMHQAIGLSTKQLGLTWTALSNYPTDRRGKGAEYWSANHEALLAAFGGEVNGQARDPLPADLRPRDAFLWQRSARSITGDQKDWLYPPLDYLFAYWLATNAASLDAVPEKS